VSAGAAPAPPSPNPTSTQAGQPTGVIPSVGLTLDDAASREAVEEAAELYIWLAAEGDLEGLADVVQDECVEEPVGRGEGIVPHQKPVEVFDVKVTLSDRDGDKATVSYDVMVSAKDSAHWGEPAFNRLTGELSLAVEDELWLVSCPGESL
jgi:hypothetical protein